MRKYRDYKPSQTFLMPPSPCDWLPPGHIVWFIMEVVDELLDLSLFDAAYQSKDGRGSPPYHPAMMVKLLLYAYITGKPSSRKIEQATYTDVAFRVLAANQHPDHDSIAAFRRLHLDALAALFCQVLRLCQKAGLVTLEHVALDGTKVKANASKHKAMSYERMEKTEQKLEKEIAALLQKAEDTDLEEDERLGKGQKEGDLPAELERREKRLEVIRKAKRELEEEAREDARQQAEVARAKIEERRRQEEETGVKAKGRDPQVPDPEQAKPKPKAQKNFTDPESRIMLDGATKGFEQAYNAQAVVDGHRQIIVAADVTDEANDKRQLVPMLQQTEVNTGLKPKRGSADTGFFSQEAVTDPSLKGIDLYVAVKRSKREEEDQIVEGEAPEDATVKEQMEHKLKTEAGKAVYARRKQIVEPVFGQVKEERGFRRFSFRGKENVQREWKVVCVAHNLVKLYRSGEWRKWLPGVIGNGTQGAVALNAA